jgi:hypothetical protein
MSRCVSLLAPALACTTLLLTGALAHQTAPSPPLAPSLFKPQSAPQAAAGLLDEVLALLDTGPSAHGPGIEWLSMNLWQKMSDGENTFEVHGRLLRGPHHRFRLELDIQSQKGANLLQVCDGAVLWETHGLGDDPSVLYVYALPQATAEKQRFLADKAIADVRPLLERIRAGLQDPVAQRGIWEDMSAIRISGAWQPDDGTPADLRPPLRPRLCHVYLDARSHWPFRIEWWGSKNPVDPPALLLEIEFRDTVINQPPSEEEMPRLFCVPAMK